MGSSYLIVSILVFTITIFLAFRNYLGSTSAASLGVLLFIQGSAIISIYEVFQPANLAYVYFAFIVLIISTDLTLKKKIVFIIMYAALVTAYISLSFGLLFVLIAFSLIFAVGKSKVWEKKRSNELFKLLSICFLIFLGWMVFVAFQFFLSTGINWITKFLTSSFFDRFILIQNVGSANLGQSLPFWANSTRLFWLFFEIVLSSILALRLVLNFKRLSVIQKNLLGCFAGTIAFGLIAILISPGGSQLNRILLYTPFFAIPIIMLSMKKKPFIYLIIAILLVSSFSTFLTSNYRISYAPTYPDEIAAGNFLGVSYGTGNNLLLYSTTWSDSFASIVTYNAGRSEEGDSAYNNVDTYWQRINTLVYTFESQSASTGIDSLFVVSGKFNLDAQHLLGIKSDDEHWIKIVATLSQDNRVYSNGNVVLFANPS